MDKIFINSIKNFEISLQLLSSFPEVINRRDCNEWTGFIYVCRGGYVKIALTILSSFPEVGNQRTIYNNNTGFILACEGRHTEIALEILSSRLKVYYSKI